MLLPQNCRVPYCNILKAQKLSVYDTKKTQVYLLPRYKEVDLFWDADLHGESHIKTASVLHRTYRWLFSGIQQAPKLPVYDTKKSKWTYCALMSRYKGVFWFGYAVLTFQKNLRITIVVASDL